MSTKLTILCRGYVPRKITVEHVKFLLTTNRRAIGSVDIDLFRHVESGTEFKVMSPSDCSGLLRNYFDGPRREVEPELFSLNNDAAMLPTGMIVSPELAEKLARRRSTTAIK